MHLGLIGYGTIAQALADLLTSETGVRRVTALVRPGREPLVPSAIGAIPVFPVTEARALVGAAPDLVVECAGHEAVTAHVPPLLRSGIDVVVVSIGALADAGLEAALRKGAREGGARVVLPAGAVGGIDILSALSGADAPRVRYTGTKPPHAWRGTPAEQAVDLSALTTAATFFEGTAREAARAYPRNANVAATLALAGPGFEATEVRLVADPAASGNVHAFEAVSGDARVTMRIENQPSRNAKTSRSTILSVLREIRNLQGPMVI